MSQGFWDYSLLQTHPSFSSHFIWISSILAPHSNSPIAVVSSHSFKSVSPFATWPSETTPHREWFSWHCCSLSKWHWDPIFIWRRCSANWHFEFSSFSYPLRSFTYRWALWNSSSWWFPALVRLWWARHIVWCRKCKWTKLCRTQCRLPSGRNKLRGIWKCEWNSLCSWDSATQRFGIQSEQSSQTNWMQNDSFSSWSHMVSWSMCTAIKILKERRIRNGNCLGWEWALIMKWWVWTNIWGNDDLLTSVSWTNTKNNQTHSDHCKSKSVSQISETMHLLISQYLPYFWYCHIWRTISNRK